jgi:hypothetical protein
MQAVVVSGSVKRNAERRALATTMSLGVAFALNIEISMSALYLVKKERAPKLHLQS